MKRFSLVLFISLVALSKANATYIKQGDLKIEKIGVEQGFYQNSVTAIASDANGYIWCGTTNGLLKFDGYSFDHFDHNPEDSNSIPDNYITCLLNGGDDILWIGAMNNIALYLADKEQLIPVQNTNSKVEFIKEDPQKRIWVGSGSKLYVFEMVEDDLNALAALRYMDRNPVRAGIVEDPATYAWSSCRSYALGVPNLLIHFHPSYLGLSPYARVRQRHYCAILAPSLNPHLDDRDSRWTSQRAVGSPEFLKLHHPSGRLQGIIPLPEQIRKVRK